MLVLQLTFHRRLNDALKLTTNNGTEKLSHRAKITTNNGTKPFSFMNINLINLTKCLPLLSEILSHRAKITTNNLSHDILKV